jgi:hypothetical protein
VDQGWTVTSSDAHSGSYSAQATTDDGLQTDLTLGVYTAAGDISFKVKTSTEADYDFISFSINGVEQARWSGENAWQDSGVFTVTEGVHLLKWTYHKDGSMAEGEDKVWIDDLIVPIDSDRDGMPDYLDTQPYVADSPLSQ